MNARAELRVRQPAVAGAFYPAGREALVGSLRECFAAAMPEGDIPTPKALVVPHAGFIYSGPVAASAYLHLVPGAASIRRVVVLGPSHRVSLRGMAVPSADAFATPLGIVPIDVRGREAVLDLPGVQLNDEAHALEHSIEVQLPFLQFVLGSFELLPLAVGRCSTVEVVEVLDALWDDPDTLVVVSTDLSHYLSYEDANQADSATTAKIVSAAFEDVRDTDACGASALRGLLAAARIRGRTVEQLDVRNSGDTAGDRNRVVGYGAFAVC
ncbi:MAG: AmmeMemoRadiSam system protein B [Microthrixaceae bacterium]|nr:AmmeMemoRadiSam system protein B [Microthrixaceae bacterium]